MNGLFSKFLLLFLCLPCASVEAYDLVRGADGFLTLHGYYKNLIFTSKRAASGDPYIADLSRLRLDLEASLFKILSARVIWDNEWIGGDYVATEEFAARQRTRNSSYLNLDYEISREHNFFYGQNLYRATLTVDTDFLFLRLGRQKIDWGVARLLSPNDLFTPLTIFNVERAEKVGVDAASLRIPFGATSGIHLVHAVHEDFDRARTAGRITYTLWRFDISAGFGRFQRDWIGGIDFSGDIWDIGWRGELTYNRSDVGDDFFQAAFGLDYAWPNTFYLLFEYFYNGQATNRVIPGAPQSIPGAQPIKTSHQNFLSTQVSYDFTPIIKGNLFAIVDLNGGSAFISPELVYGVLPWLDWTFGVHLFFGRETGEFTPVPHVYYSEAKLFF